MAVELLFIVYLYQLLLAITFRQLLLDSQCKYVWGLGLGLGSQSKYVCGLGLGLGLGAQSKYV